MLLSRHERLGFLLKAEGKKNFRTVSSFIVGLELKVNRNQDNVLLLTAKAFCFLKKKTTP